MYIFGLCPSTGTLISKYVKWNFVTEQKQTNDLETALFIDQKWRMTNEK